MSGNISMYTILEYNIIVILIFKRPRKCSCVCFRLLFDFIVVVFVVHILLFVIAFIFFEEYATRKSIILWQAFLVKCKQTKYTNAMFDLLKERNTGNKGRKSCLRPSLMLKRSPTYNPVLFIYTYSTQTEQHATFIAPKWQRW